MRSNAAKVAQIYNFPRNKEILSLSERSDEVLIAVAVLGLIATMADGEASPIEIEKFTSAYRQRFALSRKRSMKLISVALHRIKIDQKGTAIDNACDTLNEYLTLEQKMKTYDSLADILIADAVIHDGEAWFMDYIARKLKLEDEMERFYA